MERGRVSGGRENDREGGERRGLGWEGLGAGVEEEWGVAAHATEGGAASATYSEAARAWRNWQTRGT